MSTTHVTALIDHAAIAAKFNISAWAIRNPIATILLFILLTFAGLLAFRAMKIQQFPDIDLPMVTVSTSLPGAAPSQLESDVARKLENAIATLQGVKHQYSRISDGLVTITVEFRLEKNLQVAVEEVRSAVAKVRADLPSAARDPIVNKLDLASSPVLAYTIASKRLDTEALSWFVDNTITKQMLSVRGVGAVNRVGGVNREVRVELDPVRLQGLHATAADISRRLAQVQIERAGGKTDAGGIEQPLRTISTVATADALAALPIALSDGRQIHLEAVGNIVDGYAKPTAAAFLDGKPVVGFEIVRAKGASDIEVGAGVRAMLQTLRAEHPDLQITESFDFVTPVQQDYDASLVLLYEGALLAILVVWLFLRDLRATFIAAVALPLSAIPAFAGMLYMGFTINVVTLLALSLVVGILVDDAIVEVENIVRHMRMGKTAWQAAIDASAEIGLAVMATTATLIAVFLPTAFMSGVVGKFFVQFGWTAALAIFASLVVARLLTPMMAAYMLRPLLDESHISHGKGPWARFQHWLHSHPTEPAWLQHYMRWANWCLHHRWLTLILAIVFFIGSIFLVRFIPVGFIPPDDNSQTQIYLELAPGSTLEDTIASAETARQLVMQIPELKSIYTTIGGGSAGADPFAAGLPETRKATLTIQLRDRGSRPRKQVIENQIRAKLTQLPGVRSKVGLGGSGEKYQLTLSGSDAYALNTAATAVERDLRQIKGVGNIESSAALVRSEVTVIPNLARAAELGVTSSDIAETLRVATVGDYDNLVAKLNFSERQIPIIVRLADSGLQSLDSLERLSVPGSRGPVPLGQVASLHYGGGPAQISRMDRERNINFNVELAGLPLGEMQELAKDLPSLQNLPAGVRQLAIGDAEAMAEMMSGFGLAMLTGIFLIYAVLVLLFGSFLHPITILGALPLSFGGAFLGLLISGKLLAMPSLIGLLMLMGIATKNSILLVDYATLGREAGKSRIDALLDACHKRARPIIMTSIAMGAGMLPIALEWGSADGSFRAPMAVAVIGGLVTSTILSLLVIPPLYTLIDDLGLKVNHSLRRLFGRQQAAVSSA